jgi:asparagine synthase (glutamine-hydrolysing)
LEPRAETEEALVEELERLLEGAVRRQLVADVPVGVLLSGGLDSSLIAAMASRATSAVRTFTIRFPGHGDYDETAHARLIATHFATQHSELDAAEATPELLPALARQFDEPLVDSSMFPTYLVTRLVRQHCTVALGGDGGDELFGGYTSYDRLLRSESRMHRTPPLVRRSLAMAATAAMPLGVKGRSFIQQFDADLESSLPTASVLFDRANRRRLMPRVSPPERAAEVIREERISRASDLLQRATRTDFENYLPEDVLVKVDRASMLNSLEVRAPLLDAQVVDFAFRRVPSSLKATPQGRKILLKRLAARVLPSSFDVQRKQGFSIPLGTWLRSGPWHDAFRQVLLSVESTVFDHRQVSRLLDGQARGRSNSERLFALMMFELWRREYRVTVPQC